jgi:hypothetical protein
MSLPSEADHAQSMAFFGFDLINTSLEATSPAEEARLRELDALFRQKADDSRHYDIVDLSSAIQAEAAAEVDIRNCNGCERDLARKAHAELAAWGTVQKVSNLILNINLYIENIDTGQMVFVKSVDIRGNTDDSWQHGLGYMLRHYLLTDSN